MKTKYKHIYFEAVQPEGPVQKGYKIAYWCFNNKSNEALASITWYIQWKRYVFESYDGAIFDRGCLLDVVDFLNQLSK